MPRPIWSGSISFGLVNVPVKLFSAVTSQDVRFHQLRKADSSRIRQKRVSSADGEEVPYDEIVKGYEIGPDQYVIIEPEELAALDPKATQSIDIEEFVDLDQIDPIYYEHPYYLVPDKRAEKAYALLTDAMLRTNKVAIARFVMRTKQYLAALRPAAPTGDGGRPVLVLSTMLYADEVVPASQLDALPAADDDLVTERELTMAQSLIDSLTVERFEPEKFHDTYRERVLELIDAKAAGQTVAAPPAAESSTRVVDLMAALEASVKAAKERRAASEQPEQPEAKPKSSRRRKERVTPEARRTAVEIDGKELTLSNLDKILYPDAHFTKAEVIDYYRRIAPVMLPHLAGRPITFKRYPNGVDGPSFFEKNCPSHRPSWVRTVEVLSSGRRSGRDRSELIKYCLIESPAHLVWSANLAALELHPGLQTSAALDRPTWVVFDLDPGAPADVVTCADVALAIRDVLAHLDLVSLVKTSGSKGLQLYVPLNTDGVTFDDTRQFALALGQLLERQLPDLVTTTMAKDQRPNKIFVDWSQNTFSKTTIAVYSMRARARPTVSTPVSWAEIETAVRSRDPSALRFEAGEVLERVEQDGDLFAPLLTIQQALPAAP